MLPKLHKAQRLCAKHCRIYLQYRKSFCHSPIQKYNSLLKSFTIREDQNQRIVVQQLDNLYHRILVYKPPHLPKNPSTDSLSQSMGMFNIKSTSTNLSKLSFFGSRKKKIIHSSKTQNADTTINGINVPNGLYIYGGNGTGKTMLMDLFYESITNHKKQRVHFNKFMLDIYDSLHKLKQNLKCSDLSAQEISSYDPIPYLSLSLAQESTILCLDEFQITDVTDALLLNRLFTSLFYYGIIAVATSNREPNMLYWNGLQREQVFVPFLKLLEKKMNIIDLHSIDYRAHQQNKNVYFEPSVSGHKTLFEDAWKRIVECEEYSKSIDVLAGRKLICPRCKIDLLENKSTRFKFNELCSTNLGSADYVSLSKAFDTIFIEDIPYFDYENRNEMKRFILLIDELYNTKNQIVCSAADKPNKLLNIDKSGKDSGLEDMFQFDRCSSRLSEMNHLIDNVYDL